MFRGALDGDRDSCNPQEVHDMHLAGSVLYRAMFMRRFRCTMATNLLTCVSRETYRAPAAEVGQVLTAVQSYGIHLGLCTLRVYCLCLQVVTP